MMEIQSNNSPYSIFDYSELQRAGLDNLSKNALANGVNFYQKGDFKHAVIELKRSIALSPNSDDSLGSYNYLASAYLKMGDDVNALKTYIKAMSIFPENDQLNINIGNIYFSKGMYAKAEKEYRLAARKNPKVENYYSLAHCCLNEGKIYEAERFFNKVIDLSPKTGDGQYGLGMTYSKQGKYELAIEEFRKAENLKQGFYDVNLEMGCAFSDMGNIEEAKKQYDILMRNDEKLANILYVYMYKTEKPEMVKAQSDNFNWNLSIKTSLTSLNNYLNNKGEKKIFSVRFQFSKQMDIVSVQNPLNWRIRRSDGYGPFGYNFGLKIPETEVKISEIPINILYDPSSQIASVTFAIQQNDQGDGTIDPSHIEFSFSGEDALGLKMDKRADGFSRFEGFA